MLQSIGEDVGRKVRLEILVVVSAAGIIWFYKHPDQWNEQWRVIARVAAGPGMVGVAAVGAVLSWIPRCGGRHAWVCRPGVVRDPGHRPVWDR